MIDINSLLGEKYVCECGKEHSCDIKKVVIKKGAVSEIGELCAKYKRIMLVCDTNTYEACARQVEKLLKNKLCSTLVFESEGFLVPNEKSIQLAEEKLTGDTELIVGVGSGVINDLCKYVSYKHGLPYYIVATAPSMDGYASNGAAMIINNMKITYSAHVPQVIIGDTDILRAAPIEMIKAGYGDIIGKYSCLNDWKLSYEVNGEYICDFIYRLTLDTVNDVAELASKLLERDEESIGKLMYALVTVGVAMSYMGNSRPASGSEHHLSHFFEVVGLLNNEPYFCHGTDVAYSTYVTQRLREKLLAEEIPHGKQFDKAEWERNIKEIYTNAAEGIIALQEKFGWIYQDKSDIYDKKWQQIKSILSQVPSSEEIKRMLCEIGLDLDDFYNTYGEKKICNAVSYAKDLKDRYTVLWLYNSLKLK